MDGRTMMQRQAPGSILGRAARKLPFAPKPVVLNDAPMPWRMDWGGRDPATPIAELIINYHNTAWATMIFVCTMVAYMMRKV